MPKTACLLVVFAALAVAGCDATLPPPAVQSVYLGTGTPTPRPDSARVEVYYGSDVPARPYASVGELEIANTGRKGLSVDEMISRARREARRLGGDAVIIETRIVRTDGTVYPITQYDTGGTAYYDAGRGERLALKGTVIAWK